MEQSKGHTLKLIIFIVVRWEAVVAVLLIGALGIHLNSHASGNGDAPGAAVGKTEPTQLVQCGFERPSRRRSIPSIAVVRSWRLFQPAFRGANLSITPAARS